MELQERLLGIERELWTGGPEEYRRNLHTDCLVAFTDDMAGVSSRDEIAGSVPDGPRWRDLDLQVRGLLRPSDDVAFLTYRASARRGDSDRYEALVSSGYIRREGEWRMVFHQQTPLAS